MAARFHFNIKTMELTIQQELGKPNTYQAEVLLQHGNSHSYETKWFTLTGPEDAKLLASICEAIYYKTRASGWSEPDCCSEDVAARLSAILNEDEELIFDLICNFHRRDGRFDEGTAGFERLRLHYFDSYGVWHRVYMNNRAEIGRGSSDTAHS